MDGMFEFPSPLSKESIYNKLAWIDRTLLKLDHRQTPYVAPHLSKDDLIDIFVEARVWLLMQLDSLGELNANEMNEGSSFDSLNYTYSTEDIRNRIRDGW